MTAENKHERLSAAIADGLRRYHENTEEAQIARRVREGEAIRERLDFDGNYRMQAAKDKREWITLFFCGEAFVLALIGVGYLLYLAHNWLGWWLSCPAAIIVGALAGLVRDWVWLPPTINRHGQLID